MSDFRLRRNARRINDGLRRQTRLVGQDVLWYVWIAESVEDEDSDDPGSVFDSDLYDEGGSQSIGGNIGTGQSAQWYAPITVRVYQAILNEGSQEFQPEGQYTVDRLTLIVSYESLKRAGIPNPTDRGAHTNDRIDYDGRLFSVDSFNPRGRISNNVFTVTVQCLEIKDDELQVGDQTWWTDTRPPVT